MKGLSPEVVIDEWLQALRMVIFGDNANKPNLPSLIIDKTPESRNLFKEPDYTTPLPLNVDDNIENDLYAMSSPTVPRFEVEIVRNETSVRLSLSGRYCLETHQQHLHLKTADLPQFSQLKYTWPLEYVRRFGSESNGSFFFEAGRRTVTGEGKFYFRTPEASSIVAQLRKNIEFTKQMKRSVLFDASPEASDPKPIDNSPMRLESSNDSDYYATINRSCIPPKSESPDSLVPPPVPDRNFDDDEPFDDQPVFMYEELSNARSGACSNSDDSNTPEYDTVDISTHHEISTVVRASTKKAYEDRVRLGSKSKSSDDLDSDSLAPAPPMRHSSFQQRLHQTNPPPFPIDTGPIPYGYGHRSSNGRNVTARGRTAYCRNNDGVVV